MPIRKCCLVPLRVVVVVVDVAVVMDVVALELDGSGQSGRWMTAEAGRGVA